MAAHREQLHAGLLIGLGGSLDGFARSGKAGARMDDSLQSGVAVPALAGALPARAYDAPSQIHASM